MQWSQGVGVAVDIVSTPETQKRLIEYLGPGSVRNAIIVRVPDGNKTPAASSWLAPYLSLVRRSALVLCRSADGRNAEKVLAELVDRTGIRPATVTILADYNSIRTVALADARLEGYSLDLEPCSGWWKDGPSAFGVGRIPFSSSTDASFYISRTVVRDRVQGAHVARVLLKSNPSTYGSALPLCETISRATAEEFANFGIPVDAFFSQPPDDPDALAAKAAANIILYEGHSGDQRLFEDPLFFDEEEDAEPVPEAEWVNLVSFKERPPLIGEPLETRQRSSRRPAPRVEDRLNGSPLVFLQSCYSFDENVAAGVMEAGGLALIGSTTSVHSASGSAFAKAFCDGLLYRGGSIGEALRDARNYFLCLSTLRGMRNHRQSAKGYRVAFTFRLIGDPELRFLPPEGTMPRLAPTGAGFTRKGNVRLTTPAARLPKVSTETYTARIFPGSELAGVVRRVKKKAARRLMPMRYHRLNVATGLEDGVEMKRASDKSKRAVCLVDAYGRYAYVLYFPKKEIRNAKWILEFD